MATFMETETETETETTPLFVVISAPDAMDPHAVAAASSVVPAPDDPRAAAIAALSVKTEVMDPRAAPIAASSVKTEEFRRGMIDLKETLTSLGLIPSQSPPKLWFPGLTGWFPRLARLWRLSLVDILHRRELATDRQLVKDCLDYYNRHHPGNEYEPILGNVTQNPYLHNGICWVHGNFVARKKGSGVFSFLTAPRSVFFFELAYMDGFKGVVTCTTVEEPAYSVLGYPLWWATRTSGKLDSFCKTCHCRFGIPRPGVQKISSCGHSNVAEVCEMCYCCSHTLHPDPGEFAFGYHHPYHPYPKRSILPIAVDGKLAS